MFYVIFYVLSTIWLCLAFLVTSLFFFTGLIGLFRSSHRSPLFFSYSHKDSELAQRIMKRLAAHRFKIWIDTGIKISPERLEIELRKEVADCEIFILLTSVNSVGSDWVRFEIEEAKKMPELPEESGTPYWHRFFKRPKGRFRDTIVLSVDGWGNHLHEEIELRQEELRKEYSMGLEDVDWAEELEDLPPWLYQILATGVKGIWKVMTPHSSVRRIVSGRVFLFELNDAFDQTMQQLAKHISESTQVFRYQSKGFIAMRVVIILFYGSLMLLWGSILLSRLRG